MQQQNNFKAFLNFTIKVIVVHLATYILMGAIMSNIIDYGELFRQDIIKDFMHPYNSPQVAIGPYLQLVRGLLFAIALWPIRSVLLEKKHGWLILWTIFVVFGILSTPAAAPCSIEGVIYSKLPLWYHLLGLPEIMVQTLIFSIALVLWDKRSLQKAKGEEKQSNPLVTEIVKAVVTACFAYIGYAIGGLLNVALIGTEVDMEAAASDLKTQMMFVVAFVINAIAVFFIARRWVANKISIWLIFAIFLAIDTIVPMLYQLVVFASPAPIHLALLLGFFPALIIAVSVRFNYKKSAQTDSEGAQ
ncbi:MAG: hypothetical protein JXA14_23780 [Anaerolineae bacterium]|nr:hypothetical protein [Anaerolineae bacterium]